MSFPPQEDPQPQTIITSADSDGEKHVAPVADSNADSPIAQNPKYAIQKALKNGGNLTLASDWERSIISIKTVDELIQSPYRKSDTLQLSAGIDIPFLDSWSGYAAGGVDLATGSSAFISDGYSMIATAGASYAVNPKLKFSIGLLTNKSFFSSLQAMPIIGLDWDITDRLKLRTLNGAFLSYALSKSTEIDVSLQYLDQTFAVENMQGTVFMRMDQPLVLEESSIIGSLGVRHYWKDVFSIRAFAEIAGNREIHTPAPSDGVNVIEAPKSDDRRISFGVEGGIRF